MMKMSKGHNFVKNVGTLCRLTIFFAHRLMMPYIYTKFHENISKGSRLIEQTRFS